MICASVDSSGFLVNSVCSSGALILMTQDEFDASTKSAFDLSPSDAVSLAWLIIGTWLVAWSFKQVARVFQQGDPEK